jgi:hypothetical protein
MSSIERGDIEIHTLFDEVLVPIAALMRTQGATAFPSKPDASVASYYVQRPKPAMSPDDFRAPSCDHFEDLERVLGAHWTSENRENLKPHVAQFVAAARAAYTLADQGPEVSPFVYVMF